MNYINPSNLSPIPGQVFLQALSTIFALTSAISLFDKQAVITTGRIALMILFSAAMAVLLTDPELDFNELGQLTGNFLSKCTQYIISVSWIIKDVIQDNFFAK